MSPRIVSIEKAGPALKARRLVFDDETEPRLTSAAAVRELGLSEGSDIPSAKLDSALEAVEHALAKQKAVELLGYRERSTAELARGLRDCGYGSDLVNTVVARMQALALVDDARFAGMWVRSRVAAGMGPRRILRELSAKGVPSEIAHSAVQAECLEDGQLRRARETLRGAKPADRKARDRLVRRLITRGFSLSTALEAVDGIAGSDGDSCPG